MSHLLYSSNEMYSSTELIRKSKTIFNKIIDNEIDKAIIMRDGKPSFMLLDFKKKKKIMAEYDKLKAKKKNKKIEQVEVEKVEVEKVEVEKEPKDDVEIEIEVETEEKKKQEIKEFWA